MPDKTFTAEFAAWEQKSYDRDKEIPSRRPIWYDYVTTEPDRFTFSFALAAAENGAVVMNHVEAIALRGVARRDHQALDLFEDLAVITLVLDRRSGHGEVDVAARRPRFGEVPPRLVRLSEQPDLDA